MITQRPSNSRRSPTSSSDAPAAPSPQLYGPAIGNVHAIRSARITLEHVAPRKRIGVVGYVTLQSEGAASEINDVQCGIPGFDHPGTELYGNGLQATDPLLRFEIRGKRHASFFGDYDYRSEPDA